MAESQATTMANYRLDCVDDEIALSYDNPPVSINDEMEGVVTFGDDWLNFHFQSISSTEILRDLQFNMNDLYNSVDFPSITQTPAFVTGAPCVARYSKDNKWYRAKLFDISYSVVYFVDYGNKQMTNLENVKPLTRTLAELVPPLALQCTLINFQNPLLPSFVESSEIIKVTVHSKHEPYEVSVRVPSQPQTNNQSNFNNGSSARQNGRRPAAVTSSSSYRPSNGAANRAQTAQGLTLPSVRSSSKFASEDDTEDDIERMKYQNRRTRLVNNGGKLSVTGAAGTVMQIYATCGQIAPPDGPYRVNVFEFNSQESTLDNGVLTVEDLSRIFKTGDKLICNARFEDPLPQGTLVNKISKPPQGYYQVTDIQLVPSSRILICHAIVVFVSNEGIGLYMRNRRESIFAPVSSFPERKQDMLMSEFVELGRSVVVRCALAEQFPDLQVTAEWVALAVEFLGHIVESQGWMYFIRENYSVIITDGGVGFGYVFVQNQFVDPVGIRQSKWYGTRAIFRACIDVPDKQDFRFGTRWKALSVRLMPEHSKGPFRYPGIYRPTPIPFYEDAVLPAAKKTDDEMEDNFELPEEALEEMRVMGQDQIGIDSLRSGASKPKAFLSEMADNLLNEQEELTLNVNEEDSVLNRGSGDNNGDGGQTRLNGPTASGVSSSSTTIDINGELKNIDVLLEDAVSSMPKPKYNPTANDPTVEDLLGLSTFTDDYELQPCSSTMLRCIPSKSLPKRVSPYEELMNLWEGSPPNISVPVDQNHPIQNGTSLQNGTSCNKASQNAIPLPSKSSIKNEVQPQNNNDSSLTQILFVDQACQPSDEDQLKDEIRILRDNPEIFAKVVAYVATLSAETQQKFFLRLAHTN